MEENNSLSKKLSFLSSGSFDNNPFDDDTPSPGLELESSQKKSKETDEIPQRKKDKFKKLMEESGEFLDKYADDIIYEFDNYIEKSFVEDEDVNLRNSLIGLGRKYARTTQTDAETSEVTKAFSANEKALSDLYDDIQKDKVSLQKDIDAMRVMRTKNFKTLSDLVTAKSTYHNTALSVIKELNSIKKAQFDIQFKTKKKDDDDTGGSEYAANKAIQNLFGIGRDNILGSVGGYEGASGAGDESSVSTYDDEFIQSKYFNKDDMSESDGDKFLKYEDMGVEYVLLIDDNNHKEVIAEDAEGNIVPDYPMPTNLDELNFDLSGNSGFATDDLHRKYKVRHV